MKRYTKSGDAGITSLVHAKNVVKSDARVNALGALEELSSHIGLVKNLIREEETIQFLDNIGQILVTIMSGISDSLHNKYKVKEDDVHQLEQEIDVLETLFECPAEWILSGKNSVSAQIDVARAVARRAERELSQVSVKFGSDVGAKQYLNRLSDYLYMLARYYDAKLSGTGKISVSTVGLNKMNRETMNREIQKEELIVDRQITNSVNLTEESLIQQVLLRMGCGRMTLESSKKLIEKIEEEAQRRGKQAVIAVCGPDGNPIAVHVMDGAFLVSFDVAVKKAYTSVAVKMSTMELSKLAQPGQTFYGVDKMAEGKIVIFGGGVPLIYNGTIIGGLGISGGTGEEDHSLAEYALSVLEAVL